MSNTTILVTGASGHLGRRVVELLVERGEKNIVATTRTPEKLRDLESRGVTLRQADFDDDGSLAKAFAGVERALLVSTDSLDRPGRRVEQHTRAIRAFEAAGVKHVAYTSLPGAQTSTWALAPDHAATEKALAASTLGYSVLGNAFYTELLLGTLPGAVASGQLIDAKGDGATSYVTREDCARAAVAALTDGFEGRRTLAITGPEAITSNALAAIVSSITGKPVVHVNVPVGALVEGMVQHGLPRPMAEVYAGIDVSVARGEFGRVSSALLELTGKHGQTVRAFLEAHRAALGA